jgi:hypothetical protein
MNPFSWLRVRVAQAGQDGLDDALQQLDRDAPADLAEAAARLESRSCPALPAPEVNGTPENGLALSAIDAQPPAAAPKRRE